MKTALRLLFIPLLLLGAASVVLSAYGQTPPTFVNPTLFNGGSVINDYSPIPVQVVRTGDFNNDGVPDLLTLDDNGNTAGVGIMLGNGAGGFGPVSSITTFSCTLEGGIVTGDFNNDGNLDFAVVSGTAGGDCNFNPGTLWIFLGNGAGGFTLKASYSEIGGPANNEKAGGLIAADLRGNGNLDLLAIDPNNGIDVFLGNGDGTFAAPTVVGISSPGASNSEAVADLNHDGKLDLVVASENSGDGIYVLLGNGDGTFQAPVFYQQGSNSGAMAVAIGALTKTSHGDVVMGTGNGAYVYLNNGDGTFKTPPALYGPSWINSIVITDVNGDKKNDLVVSSYSSGAVWFMPGNGKGGFGTAEAFATAGQPNNVVVADFNGDKKLDFATSNIAGQWISVGFGNGDGTFRASQGNGYGWNNPINGIATADLNGDGYPDVVMANGGTGVGISVQLGSSHGVLGPATSIAVGGCGNANRNPVNSVALGDVNGDKKIDVVTTSVNSGGGCVNNEVGVLLGSGKGKFKAPVFYSTGTTQQSYNATLADLRGKGLLDIIVSNNDGSISVLLNNGKGVYGTANVISGASGSEGAAIAVGDFNNDGKLDLALSNYSGTAINILLGKGDGTFQAPIINPSSLNPVGMVAGDFNHDGNLDVAVSSWDGSGSFIVLLGNGAGVLTQKATYNFGPWEQCYPSGGSNPYYIGAADLNQDGNLDLALGVQYSSCDSEYSGQSLWGNAIVYSGNGDGTFTQVQSAWLAGGEGASGLVLADFNNDGMIDMAVAGAANWTTQEWVSVIQNSTQPVSLSPNAMTFAAEAVGSSSKAQTVIITNDQTATLDISKVALGGTDPGDFVLKNGCGSSLLTGANCTLTVTFKPSASGSRTATLSITDGAGTQNVALTGTGK
ncbi:MAG: FG-GAP-like repeat-containing protein [Terriglobales bacterium]